MPNRIVICAALYLPACLFSGFFLYRFACFLYIDAYLAVGSVQASALGSAFMMLSYALFLRWANAAFTATRNPDRLRDLALLAPLMWSASAMLVATIEHSLRQDSLSGLVPDPVAMVASFVVLAAAGYLYVVAAALAVGLSWLIRSSFGRLRAGHSAW